MKYSVNSVWVNEDGYTNRISRVDPVTGGRKMVITPEVVFMGQMFKECYDEVRADFLNLPAALFAQAQHLKSDEFTKLGLPVPLLSSINEEFSSKLYRENYDALCFARDAKIVGVSFVVSKLFDIIISLTHGLFTCRRLAMVHKELEEMIRPGISTREIDIKGDSLIRKMGGIPNFLHYNGFPASICVSVNDEVVHGIPSRHRILQEGDIVSLDAGMIYKGYHSDEARTHGVGQISPEARRLIDATRESF